MVITDCNKNKEKFTEISIINKQMKGSITKIRAELRQKHGQREHV